MKTIITAILIIVAVAAVLFILPFAIMFFSYVFGIDMDENGGLHECIATYIATPTTTVIALYCWKAKAENIIKIKKGYPEETKDISVDLNNINI